MQEGKLDVHVLQGIQGGGNAAFIGEKDSRREPLKSSQTIFRREEKPKGSLKRLGEPVYGTARIKTSVRGELLGGRCLVPKREFG